MTPRISESNGVVDGWEKVACETLSCETEEIFGVGDGRLSAGDIGRDYPREWL